MLDTCIVSYYFENKGRMSDYVGELFNDYNNLFYLSVVTVKELIVLFRHKDMFKTMWKSEEEMLRALTEEYYFQILPVDEQVLQSYARLRTNKAEDHNDPNDHVIIAHAMA